MNREELLKLYDAIKATEVTLEGLLESLEDSRPLIRAGAARIAAKFAKGTEIAPELKEKILDLLADEDINVRASAAEAVGKRGIEVGANRWVRVHKNETRQCLSLARMWQVFYEPSRMTLDETNHMKVCSYCTHAIDLCREEAESTPHPQLLELVQHEAELLSPDREVEVRSHLGGGCESCSDASVRRLIEEVLRSGRDLLIRAGQLGVIFEGSFQNPLPVNVYMSTDAYEAEVHETEVLAKVEKGIVRAFIIIDPDEGHLILEVTAATPSMPTKAVRAWVTTAKQSWDGNVVLSLSGKIWSGSVDLGPSSKWIGEPGNMAILVSLDGAI
jgi:hypothetical protein